MSSLIFYTGHFDLIDYSFNEATGSITEITFISGQYLEFHKNNSISFNGDGLIGTYSLRVRYYNTPLYNNTLVLTYKIQRKR